MSYKRCDNCRWWDNAPYRETGLYGDCSAPLPISLSVYRYAMVAEEMIQGDTDAQKCQCFEYKHEAIGRNQVRDGRETMKTALFRLIRAAHFRGFAAAGKALVPPESDAVVHQRVVEAEAAALSIYDEGMTARSKMIGALLRIQRQGGLGCLCDTSSCRTCRNTSKAVDDALIAAGVHWCPPTIERTERS